MKPLFIPLMGEYYDRFAAGTKTEELRLYGPRWNEKTCTPGRPVVLSRGYGKRSRMQGVISGFKKRSGQTLDSEHSKAIKLIYGTLLVPIAVIQIADLRPVNGSD